MGVGGVSVGVGSARTASAVSVGCLYTNKSLRLSADDSVTRSKAFNCHQHLSDMTVRTAFGEEFDFYARTTIQHYADNRWTSEGAPMKPQAKQHGEKRQVVHTCVICSGSPSSLSDFTDTSVTVDCTESALCGKCGAHQLDQSSTSTLQEKVCVSMMPS